MNVNVSFQQRKGGGSNVQKKIIYYYANVELFEPFLAKKKGPYVF